MKHKAGFTLLELMITLSIMAILTAIAVPSFSYMNNRRITQGQVESLQRTLSMARQTAVTKNRPTVICPSSNGLTCDDSTDWSFGYLAYLDWDKDAHLDGDKDLVIEYVPGVRNVATRTDTSGLTHKLTSSRSTVRFSAQGASLPAGNQTITYCDATQQAKFAVIINVQGRIRVSNAPQTSC